MCSYLGELVSDHDMRLRESVDAQHDHTVELEADCCTCWKHLKLGGRCSMIDAGSFGNSGRFLNHGCGTSANLTRCIVEQHSQSALLCFAASRDILVGEELRWDYFSGKEGKDKKKIMWWGACSCTECASEGSGDK